MVKYEMRWGNAAKGEKRVITNIQEVLDAIVVRPIYLAK